jgi:hypothetical protein
MKIDMKIVSIRVPEALWRQARRKAKKEKKSITALMNNMLEDYVGSYTVTRKDGREIKVSVEKGESN